MRGVPAIFNFLIGCLDGELRAMSDCVRSCRFFAKRSSFVGLLRVIMEYEIS